ncbi:polysaccharide biosynthesis tyrosine autokinase [Sporosarcina sp. UB5]|uniref:polysaccharide biosynthesis tyrosine autokinase n=1 Tax=Sporosarcina sp. UB5 TaxID=3047463 RepID=UPI003D79B0A9
MNEDIGINDLITAIRKRMKRIILLAILFLVCGGLIGYFIPPTYEAKIDLLVNSVVESRTSPQMAEIDTNLRLIETYKQILKSDRMVNKVNAKLENIYTKTDFAKKIKFESNDRSQIITIVAHDKTAERTANLANTYAETFQDEIGMLMNFDNVTILKEVVADSDTKIINYSPILYATFALFLSVVASLAIIIAKEVYYPLIDSTEKVEKILQLHPLGHMTKELGSSDRLTGIYQNFSSNLAVNVHYYCRQQGIKTIMMISPDSGEWKTFIAEHLAVAVASNNIKTVFVDVDYRKLDGFAKPFNLPSRKGLTSVILGQQKLQDVIQQTKHENLFFIGTGSLLPNPTMFLISKKMEKIIAELESEFDLIIIDTPNLSVPDAINLLPLVHGTIFVINAQTTTKKKALESLHTLKKFNGKILGAILHHGKNLSLIKKPYDT